MHEPDKPASESHAAVPPRIGIFHLMALVFGIAVLFGANERFSEIFQDAWGDDVVEDTHWRTRSLWFLNMILSASVDGVAIASLVWFWDWNRRSGRIRLQPGHWILLATGFHVLVNLPLNLIVYGLYADELLTGNYSWFSLINFPAIGVSVLILLLAWFRCRGSWRVFFFWHVLWNFRIVIDWVLVRLFPISMYGAIQIGYSAVVGTCLLASLVIAVSLDLRRCQGRDWIHRVGVAVMLLSGLREVIQMIFMWLIQSM